MIESLEVLARLFSEAEEDASGQPFIVELLSPRGASLTIGLGRDVSVATYAAAAGEPPYFVSSGGSAPGEPLVFFRDGHWTEFAAEAAIPVAVARQAANEFLVTGARPTNIEWAEV